MSIQLAPREYFTVVRQLQDHTDSTTYYVRATIRDARTDELLDVLDLVDRGNRRFSLPWLVCADSSGLGRYISVLSEVFTDDAYTTKAQGYGDEMETHLVLERRVIIPGGPSGPSVDYKKIEKMIKACLEEYKPEATQPQKPVDLKPIVKKLIKIQEKLTSFKMPTVPEIKPVELQPVISSIKSSHEAVLEAIRNIPGRDENDILPLAQALDNLNIQDLKEQITSSVEDMKKVIDSFSGVTENMPEWRDKLQEISESLKEIIVASAVAGHKAKEKPQEERKPADFTKIIARMRKK